MEKRKGLPSKFSPLPVDYLFMVSEVFKTHFEAGLKLYQEHKPQSQFVAKGEVFSDEIVLGVSLVTQGQISANTVYASCDFDPKASAPSVQELLSACVDAIGSVFGNYLTPDQPELIAKLADGPLADLENIPLLWIEMEADHKKVYVKMDKSNLEIDSLADDWLRKNDPTFKSEEEMEQEETKKLFVTGVNKKLPPM